MDGTPWDEMPRVSLAYLPTPLYEAKRLSAELGGPRILIKRDDLTGGIAIAGNKVRKCEFLFGEAIEEGADTVITTGAHQSNHARAVASCAKRLGMHAVLLLTGSPDPAGQGNLLIDDLISAEVRPFDIPAYDAEVVEAEMARIADELRAQGRKPYIIPMGGSNRVGAVGYAVAAAELVAQLADIGVLSADLINATGSWGTNAGLVVGLRYTEADLELIGMSVNWPADRHRQGIAGLATETASWLGLDYTFDPEDVSVDDGHIGPKYGVVTPECIEAIRLVARCEGILLDPVYTGKAMAGLIARVRKGVYATDETVVFLHTGGTPALFAYRDAIVAGG
jgi:D-cysteine desulfhydrase family pyridoxal phosphate-dependent enzyme